MPEILIAAIAAMGTYKAYKWFTKKMRTAQNIVTEATSAAERAKMAIKDMPKLKRDPVTGIYRLKK
ncbi:MAG: hypothetical protein COB24_00755 [Hyphomicrobiales bacterium]|nr:MAG: hypothetical protein COB24_00755 [Hyphomicrobiales bacterium]